MTTTFGFILGGFILGVCVGSFLNNVIDRLPLGQSIINPPSHCASCQRHLAIPDLIPVFSYLWLRGRCRYCGVAIPRRILAVELATGLILALLCWKYGFSTQFLVLGFYLCIFLSLAIIDLEQGLLLNKLVYPAAGIALILIPFWSQLGFSRSLFGGTSALEALLSSLVAVAIASAILLLPLLVYPGSMGWGDVKMAGMIGLLCGFPSVLVAMGIAILGGGLAASLLLLLHLKGRKQAISFGPFLSLGGALGLLWGQTLCQWYLGLF